MIAARSIIGTDALCKTFSKHCLPALKKIFKKKGFSDRLTAPKYAKQLHEKLLRPLPEGSNWSEEYKEKHSAIYELLRQDTFKERLPGLIRKWFFTL